MPSLRIIGGSVFPIPSRGEQIIGRDGVCDIVVVRRSVSRRHARISGDEGDYFVEDLGSTHGTFLNGERVSGRRPLCDGDRINLFDVPLQFALKDLPEHEGDTDYQLSEFANLEADRRLQLVLDLSSRLCTTLEVEEILPRVLDLLFHVFLQSLNGEILLADESGRLISRAMKQGRKDDSSVVTVVPHVPPLAQRVFEAGAPEFVSGLTDEESVLEAEEVNNAICAPLMGPVIGTVGVALLECDPDCPPFDGNDLEMLSVIGAVAGHAVENARTQESLLRVERRRIQFEAAREVQQAMLPIRSPRVRGYSFHHHYLAAEEVGGDCFGFHRLSEGRLGVTIADVCGKGFPAALRMAQLVRDVQHSLSSGGSLKSAVRSLNRWMCTSRSFVTFCVCLLDVDENTVSIVSAGHPVPLLQRGLEVLPAVDLDRTGYPLGVDPSADWHVTTLDVEPGDAFVVFTDGIFEQFDVDGVPFGAERLSRSILRGRGTVGSVVDCIVQDVDAYRGTAPQSDDRCVIAFGRHS